MPHPDDASTDANASTADFEIPAPSDAAGTESGDSDAFTIEHRDGLLIVTATPALERVGAGLEDLAARMIIDPLRRETEPILLFDLSSVTYFGSVFLAVMLRCWKIVLSKSGTMGLAGVSSHARELLHVTSLDQSWPIYATRREAIDALSAD